MTKAKLGTYGEDEINRKLQELPGWYYEDGWIRRQYPERPDTLMQLSRSPAQQSTLRRTAGPYIWHEADHFRSAAISSGIGG